MIMFSWNAGTWAVGYLDHSNGRQPHTVVALIRGKDSIRSAASLCNFLNGGPSVFWQEADSRNEIEWK